MKCAFDHCTKNAIAGLYGSVSFGLAKITFPLCMAHWRVVGKMQEKFEKEIKNLKKAGGKSNGKKR